MTENLDRAIAEVHARSTPGPKTDATGRFGAIGRAMRKAVVGATHHVREHQQHVDHSILDAIEAEADARRHEVAVLEHTARELRSRVEALDARVEMLQALNDDLVALVERGPGLAERIDDELSARPFMSDPDRLRYREGDSEVIGYRGALELPPMYRGFEELFRGSEELIAERQAGYVRLFPGDAPVVDLGCGRGEFLQLLGDAGIEGAGVDLDPEMVRHCREKGLVAECLDIFEYLEKVADGSLGGIFSAQVIEHLLPSDLVRLLQVAHEKLRPGGVFVAETVNPYSLRAMRMFWLDLTHQHPIYPEALLAWCALVGFEDGRVLFPLGTGDLDADLRSQGDFAVIAYVGSGEAASAA